MRGEILQYDDQAGRGLISGDDGVRYSFARADLQRLMPVTSRMRVDFVADGTDAREIFVLDAQAGAAQGADEPAPEDLGLWGYFSKCIGKYFDGQGRARRKEYWSFVLFELLFLLAAIVVDFGIYAATHPGFDPSYGDFYGFVPWLTVLAVLFFVIPGITVTIRRLHDLGMTGWVYLVGFIPYAGALFLFVCSLIPSQQGSNKHGPYPKPVETYA